jgi:hypothetical protein
MTSKVKSVDALLDMHISTSSSNPAITELIFFSKPFKWFARLKVGMQIEISGRIFQSSLSNNLTLIMSFFLIAPNVTLIKI